MKTKSKMFKVLKKELREVFRDKKSLMMMLLIPILIPFLMIGMSALFNYQMDIDEGVYNKIGFTYEVSLEEKQLIKMMEIDASYGNLSQVKEKYENGEIYLYISKKNNKYIINYDSGNTDEMKASMLANTYLENYKRMLQEKKLSNSNINQAEVLDVITIEENNVGEANYFSSYIAQYSFLFIMMAIVISATYPATDTTAGEKERGTLETLLTFPIKSRDIILGKLLSVTISSIITGVISLVLSLLSFKYINGAFSIFENDPIALSSSSIIFAFIVIVIYSFFVSGLCIAIASLSKTFKEAQSALTPLNFIAFFPGMVAFMINLKTTEWLSAVPFLNFSLIFNDISVGNINYLNIGIMFITTIIYISVVIWYIIKQYRSEKILFSI